MAMKPAVSCVVRWSRFRCVEAQTLNMAKLWTEFYLFLRAGFADESQQKWTILLFNFIQLKCFLNSMQARNKQSQWKTHKRKSAQGFNDLLSDRQSFMCVWSERNQTNKPNWDSKSLSRVKVSASVRFLVFSCIRWNYERTWIYRLNKGSVDSSSLNRIANLLQLASNTLPSCSTLFAFPYSHHVHKETSWNIVDDKPLG